jgi:Domain of unknown function (DUF4381)
MRRVGCRALLVSAVALSMTRPVLGQAARTAVVPDSITVGSVFRVAVRLTVPAAARVVFPDTLAVPANVEAAARRELDVDTADAASRTYTAIYALTAWKPGSIHLEPAALRIDDASGSHRIEATFPQVNVLSVLPPDSAGLEPRPAKDVLGPSRLMWPLLLAVVLLVAVIIATIAWWRRRRPPPVASPAMPPKEWALIELERIRRLGYLERGEWKAFYSEVSGVLRQYAAALEAEWSRDLTTAELSEAMESGLRHGVGSDRLIALLGGADLVKFAAKRPSRPEAEQAWTESLGWVDTFDWPEPAPAVTPAEAT